MAIGWVCKEEETLKYINKIHIQGQNDYDSKQAMVAAIDRFFDALRCEKCNSMNLSGGGIKVTWRKELIVKEERKNGLFGGVRETVIKMYFSSQLIKTHESVMGKSFVRCRSCRAKRKGHSAMSLAVHPWLSSRNMMIDPKRCCDHLSTLGDDGAKQFVDNEFRPLFRHGLDTYTDHQIGKIGYLLWEKANNNQGACDGITGFITIAPMLQKVDHENILSQQGNPFRAYA